DERAEFIRVQIELAAEPWSESTDRLRTLTARERQLLARLYPPSAEFARSANSVRGFPPPGGELVVSAEFLADPVVGRWRVVQTAPESFGAKTLRVEPGLLLRPEHVEPLFALPAAQRVTRWQLSGTVQEVASREEGEFGLIDLVQKPAVTTATVESMVQHKGARRITELDLRNNNLDNDAARALVKAPYLGNLKRLQLLEGNRLRGKVWQQVIERFGEDVVG
ncbi:MAG: hypothetical protein K2V38_12865, partial [Gemmataceae bacterium]|nr:hypothetical protein [Gemmataceae bacterium]